MYNIETFTNGHAVSDFLKCDYDESERKMGLFDQKKFRTFKTGIDDWQNNEKYLLKEKG